MVKRKKRDNVPCLITWTHERKEIKVTKCYTRNRRRVTQGRGRKIEREDAPWRSRAGLESRIFSGIAEAIAHLCKLLPSHVCGKHLQWLWLWLSLDVFAAIDAGRMVTHALLHHELHLPGGG